MDEVVVKRKRRRTAAIDPCLGYYDLAVVSSSPASKVMGDKVKEQKDPVILVASTSDAVDACEQEEQAHPLPSPTTRSQQDALTVEAFLQRSAERSSANKKKYGRRRKRAARAIIWSSSPSNSEPRSPSSIYDELPPVAPVRTGKRKKQKFTERIARAAFLTHVELSPKKTAEPKTSAGSPGRIPLAFVSSEDACLATARTGKRDRCSLVYPYRAPLIESCFPERPTRPLVSSSTLPRLTAKHSNEDSMDNYSVAGTRKIPVKENSVTEAREVMPSSSKRERVVPLNFVPLDEHHRAIEERWSNSRSTITRRKSKSLSHRSASRNVTKESDESSTLEQVTCHSPLSVPATHGRLASKASHVLAEVVHISPEDTQPQPAYTSNRPHSSASLLDLDQRSSPAGSPRPPTRAALPSRRLRTLSSYFDGFIDTAREALGQNSQNFVD